MGCISLVRVSFDLKVLCVFLIVLFFPPELVTTITCGFVMTLFAFFFEIKVIFWSGLTSYLLLFATSYIIWGVTISMIVYQGELYNVTWKVLFFPSHFTVLYICSNTREECCESALVVHKLMGKLLIFNIL
jgi:hypothetical protein